MPARPTETRERRFHRWLVRHLPSARRGWLPLGDDAAALLPPRRAVALLTCDALVEGWHFLPDDPPEAVGAAAVNVSLSDLAAKGGTPAAILWALLLDPRRPDRWAKAAAVGADRAARRAGAALVGGDTKASGVTALVTTAVGWGDGRRLAPRGGGRAGDLLVTTGTVGRGGFHTFDPHRADRPSARAASLTIEPRLREGRALVRFAHAMLDTSDGLAEAAALLASSSGLRAEIEAERIPWYPPLRRRYPASARRWAVGVYGGDYELLASLPPARFGEADAAVRAVGGRLTAIGRLIRGQGVSLIDHGRRQPMPRSSWDPFRSRPPR